MNVELDDSVKCPICDLHMSGTLCIEHRLKLKDFNWLKNYINELKDVNSNIVYILEYAISDRQLYIINNLGSDDILSGRFEDVIKRCGKNTKKIIREIQALEKARMIVKNIIDRR